MGEFKEKVVFLLSLYAAMLGDLGFSSLLTFGYQHIISSLVNWVYPDAIYAPHTYVLVAEWLVIYSFLSAITAWYYRRKK